MSALAATPIAQGPFVGSLAGIVAALRAPLCGPAGARARGPRTSRLRTRRRARGGALSCRDAAAPRCRLQPRTLPLPRPRCGAGHCPGSLPARLPEFRHLSRRQRARLDPGDRAQLPSRLALRPAADRDLRSHRRGGRGARGAAGRRDAGDAPFATVGSAGGAPPPRLGAGALPRSPRPARARRPLLPRDCRGDGNARRHRDARLARARKLFATAWSSSAGAAAETTR